MPVRVFVILAILAQLLIDNITASDTVQGLLRSGFGAAAILVPGGFFAAAAGKNRVQPNSWIFILYFGIAVLAVSTLGLGISLINSR